jgi:two-component system, response regulator PdtaR
MAEGGLDLQFPARRQTEMDVVEHLARNPTFVRNARHRGKTHTRRAANDVQDRGYSRNASDRVDVVLEIVSHICAALPTRYHTQVNERCHDTGQCSKKRSDEIMRIRFLVLFLHLITNIDGVNGTELVDICCRCMMTHPTDMPPVVLIVEDEPLVRMLAADVFYEKGLDVLEAPHADGALALLKDNTDIDVLFTDINMPGALNGVDLAWEVHRRWPNVALMITSARQSAAIDDMPSTAMFVPKPYDLEKIAIQIADLKSPH